MKLQLCFIRRESPHGDLVLRWNDRQWVCDSYYLAIDRETLPIREDHEKTQVVLRRLLEQWRDAVKGAKNGEMVYLPYDFSDQHTGWLRCTRADEHFSLCRVTSPLEGWSFSPSSFSKYKNDVPNPIIDEPSEVVSRHELIQSIETMIDQMG